MKKRFLSILVLLSMILIPTAVFAAEGNKLVGDTLTSPGATVSFTIKVSSPETINKYDADLTYETAVLELVSIENGKGWSGNNAIGNSPLELSFERESGVSGETDVATLTFKVKKDATKTESRLSLEGKYTTEKDGTIKNLEENAVTLQIKSTDNTLKDLKVNKQTVVNFSPTTYSYSMQVESKVTSADIGATLNNNTAKFVDKFGPRNIPLDYGENEAKIKVKAANGDVLEYVINITRNDNRGSNNDLANLIINSGAVKLNFDKDTLEYNVKTYKLKKIEVEATPVDPKAKVVKKFTEEPVIGPNEITITVTSEAGQSKEYKVILNNLDRDVDVTLKSLEVSAPGGEVELSPKFRSDVLDYEVRYEKRLEEDLSIIPEVSSEEDDVKYDMAHLQETMKDIKPGSKVEIKVYAPDGTANIYTITFVKDSRINFFTILFGVILLILLVIFIKLFINRNKVDDSSNDDKIKVYKKENENELMKTKRLNKINLE